MKTVLLFNKVINKIIRIYRKKVFKDTIGCTHNDFSLVGHITIINTNIKLGHKVRIYPGCMFFGDGPIEIGNNVEIGNNCIIYSSENGGGVTIGDDTMIAANCYIIDSDHNVKKDILIREQGINVAPVLIGKDCWLGTGVTVLRGTSIGDGAVIGAQSLVKGNVESNTVSVGIPCKVIKRRTQ